MAARHPFAGYPPIAVAEYVTSDPSRESIAMFLMYVQIYEKKIYSTNAIQFFCMEVIPKLISWYLPTIPLWTKLVNIDAKNCAQLDKYDSLPLRALKDDINTNAQAEEFF